MTKRYYKCEETHRTVNGVKLKRCTKCKRWKQVREFNKDRARKDGLKVYCKSCNIAYATKLYRHNKKPVRDYLRYEERHRVIRGIKEKLCSRCKKWKYHSEFYKNRRSKDGLSSRCKDCERERIGYKNKSSKTYLRFEDRHRVVNGIKEKFCRKCDKWKNESEFYRNKSTKDGLDGRCKECSHEAARKSLKPKKKRMRRNLRFEERHRVVGGVRQKYCRHCKRWKNEDTFYKDKSKKDGLIELCKECVRSKNSSAL
jgi:hypothetical protein